jgi:aminoglycoside phosphotransferase (APT) family kinase protein
MPSTWPRCRRYLLQHLPGFAGPLTVEQFKGGQSNPTYKLITPGRAYVMRSKPGRWPPAAAFGACRRARVPRHARAGRHAACRWRACTCCARTKAVIGRAFYVMECVDGRVLWDQSPCPA